MYTFKTELLSLITHFRLWRSLGFLSFQLRHGATFLGAFWSVGMFYIKIAALSLVYSQVFGKTIGEYFPYMALGFLVWNLILPLVLEPLSVFSRSSNYILQMRVPLSVYVLSDIFRELMIFAANGLVLVIIFAWTGKYPDWHWLQSLGGLLIIVITGYLYAFIFGFIAVRVPDIKPLFSSLMMVAFLASPILWHNRFLPDSWILTWNPFHHYLNLVREPILSGSVPLFSLTFSLVVIAVLALLASITFIKFRRPFVFWLN